MDGNPKSRDRHEMQRVAEKSGRNLPKKNDRIKIQLSKIYNLFIVFCKNIFLNFSNASAKFPKAATSASNTTLVFWPFPSTKHSCNFPTWLATIRGPCSSPAPKPASDLLLLPRKWQLPRSLRRPHRTVPSLVTMMTTPAILRSVRPANCRSLMDSSRVDRVIRKTLHFGKKNRVWKHVRL